MAAATQPFPPLLTIDEYLQTTYRPDCDFVDGHLEERIVGGTRHGLLQIQLGIWFFLHPEWNLRAVGEQRTRVSQNRVRLPDVAVIPDDEALLEEPRTTAPFIAIEIISPDDRLERIIVRLRDFLKMGVQHIWLLDPIRQTAYVFTEEGLKRVETAILTIEGSPVYLDLPQLFAALTPKRS